jgi:hypothetical protein
MDVRPSTFSIRLNGASASFSGDELSVSTNLVRRVWRRVPNGLSTVCFRREDGPDWITENREPKCDWSVFGLIDAESKAAVVSATCRAIQDDPFTADRLDVEIILHYPASDLELRFSVWVFPDAPGIRTQLSIRALRDKEPDRWPSYLTASYSERIRLEPDQTERMAVGYYCDSQHRGSFDTPMLKEEKKTGPIERREIYDWANLVYLQKNREGMVLVKESHKCVNQEGVDTGAFLLTPDDIRVTGLGLRTNGYGDASKWIRVDRFHEMWANWSILYSGTRRDGSHALKVFDRYRFPVRPKLDVYLAANTWGSRGAGEASRSAAEEDNILTEIESCADLGIDVLQIDDGWELDPGMTDVDHSDWRPAKARFPHGWKKVRTAAEKQGVILGIWHAWTAPVERIMENFDRGGFRYFKIDFVNIRFRHQLETLMDKARALFEHAGYAIRINWDLTEVTARVGYFYGREFGQIYPRNSQTPLPGRCRTDHVLYRPGIFLRDAWEYAHHLNLNQFQINVQNKDRFSRSGADRYSHSYCFAIAMMAVPNFMQETHFYSPSARDELRPLIALYKLHREPMHQGYVIPLGREPNDRSWSGFQSALPGAREGYLTVFREIENPDNSFNLELELPAGNELVLRDLVNDEKRTVKLTGDPAIPFMIPKPGDFRLFRYEVR